ncbi:MAG TPA: LysM peptidoglycan-binding domain-containing protein [Anaerolineales bacterium]|nr:LysM peptidoglycan-binding domain-containing protein [Anaerolineales bacterium]
MFNKGFARVSVLILVLMALLAVPGSARAGGVCGGTYVVEWGDTVSKIAARCGTTVSAIYAANPSLGATLYAGQSLTLPGSNSGGPCNCPPAGSGNTYVVKAGDTLAKIARHYGISVKALCAANPQISNIDLLYVGQVINIPGVSIKPAPKKEPVPLSYGTVPANTPKGVIKLSNRAKAEVYVSFQGTTSDGSRIIKEYPVSGSKTVKIPAGRYSYVAWVGGTQFTGEFKLGATTDVTITFYIDRVVVGK